MIFFDTETCGFHGPTVLVQYAYGMGDVLLHNVWLEPIKDTLELIQELCDHEEGVCGFNIVYDWFHLCQTWTTLALLAEEVGYDARPVDHIVRYAYCEPRARDGKCLKPVTALDLMLFARKGPYQSTMDRRNIRIKRVPRILAPYLLDEIEARIQLRDIFFAKRKDKKSQRWAIDDKGGDFVDLVLRFRASAALKILVQDALGVNQDKVLMFGDVGVAKKFNPREVGWAPFALALSDEDKDWKCVVKDRKGWAWPGVIEHHIDHWAYDTKARQYGGDDVRYLQQLYVHFGKPPFGDNDSILACEVGAARWRGYAVDLPAVKELLADCRKQMARIPKHPAHVKKYLVEVMNVDETKLFLKENTTKKVALEGISKWKNEDGSKHKAADRSDEVLGARKSKTKAVLLEKLIIAGRLHASSKIIGSLNSRMSGTDGLNALGIQKEKTIRKLFTFAFGNLRLRGGDFSAFEVSIADAKYDDPELRKQLLTCYSCDYVRQLHEFDDLYCPSCKQAVYSKGCKSCMMPLLIHESGVLTCCCSTPTPNGDIEDTMRKIHGLFAMELCDTPMTYIEILATKGGTPDWYDYGKRGIFSQMYGGNYKTLMTRLNIEEDKARKAEEGFKARFKGVARAKEGIMDQFCSMRQPGGIGKKVEWHEPAEYVESLNGFRRYFTLENMITKALFNLAENPPAKWNHIKLKCERREGRTQFVGGAVRSAVFAAAFAIQASNMRAAGNHEISSTGAILTKELQKRIWDLQPSGIHDWVVQPFNEHDELIAPSTDAARPVIEAIVKDFVLEQRSLVPLLRMEWKSDMQTWADK